MKIFIITQNDPFYLSENIDYLISSLPKDIKIVGCIISNASPFGRKEGFLKKSFKTFKIFGFSFFIFYSFKFIFSKLFKKSVHKVFFENKIKIIKLNNSINTEESIKKIKSLNPDLLVSILGNEIFKKPLLNIAPKGCINLHTSLLPKYRGLMPSFWVLKNNEKFTGVSVFFVDEGIDSGPIIVQEKIEIGDMSQSELIKLSKKIGMKCVIDAINLIHKNKLNLIANNDSNKTYFSFPTRNDIKEFKKQKKKFY